MSYTLLATTYCGFIFLLWLLRRMFRNAGLIDFGWPVGLIVIALYFGLSGSGDSVRSWLLASMFIICGVRFILGWLERVLRNGEDHRWELWRKKWRQKGSVFGSHNVELNFLAFYMAQAFANVLVFYKPLQLVSRNETPGLSGVEIVAALIWITAFVMENVADYQLYRFKLQSTGKSAVMRTGLWRYSRHPNYAFEFLIWCSYTLFALPSVVYWHDALHLALVPLVAYYFLVHFTGIPLTEESSLQKRGEAYRDYQRSTNRFLPWFPRR